MTDLQLLLARLVRSFIEIIHNSCQRKLIEINYLIRANCAYMSSFGSPCHFNSINHLIIVFNKINPVIRIAILCFKLLTTRLILLSHWSFLFLLLGAVGLVDGLTCRYIRRMQVGRESAFVYFHAKSLLLITLGLSVFIHLVLPLSVNALQWLAILSAVSFGLMVNLTSRHFKKYL